MWITSYPNLDRIAPVVLFVALLRAWSWYRIRHPEIEGACVIAATTTAILYQTGFPQYHMVPFVLGAAWALRYWDVPRGRIVRPIAVAGYFGWLAVFDSYYLTVGNESRSNWNAVEQIVGLPTFVVGCAFVAAAVWSSWPDGHGAVAQERNGPGSVAGPRAEGN